MTVPSGAETTEADSVMSAAVLLFVRRLVVTLLGGVASAVAARLLGVRDFGEFSAALAVYYFLLAMGDFGFSLVLGRALAASPDERPVTMRAAALLQFGLTSLLSGGALLYGWAMWGADLRFWTLAALVPALLLSGLTGYRQVFVVLHRVRTMATLDVSTAVVQTGAVVAAAAAGSGPVGVGLAMSLASAGNSAVGAALGARLVGPGRRSRSAIRAIVREALPLGVMSVLATAYFTIDVIVLGWLVDAVAIGYYAAAVKVLSILVSLPGIVMMAMLPAVARGGKDGAAVSVPVWHLVVSTVVPACAVVGVASPVVVDLLYGSDFAAAAPLLSVLALAGAVAALSGLVGTLLVAERRGFVLALQNIGVLAVNVGLNLSLVPRFGVVASAWATFATEVLVVAVALCLFKGRALSYLLSWLRVSLRPLLLLAASFAVVVPWAGRGSLVTLLAPPAVFVLVMTMTRAWPPELVALMRGRRAR